LGRPGSGDFPASWAIRKFQMNQEGPGMDEEKKNPLPPQKKIRRLIWKEIK
jgi:hypothetical protein